MEHVNRNKVVIVKARSVGRVVAGRGQSPSQDERSITDSLGSEKGEWI